MRVSLVFLWLFTCIAIFHKFVPQAFSYDAEEFYALDNPAYEDEDRPSVEGSDPEEEDHSLEAEDGL